MNFFSKCDHKIRQHLARREWKKAFALKQDYETLSEMARYVEDALLHMSEQDVKTFLYGPKSQLLKTPSISNMPTDSFSGMPETFGECVQYLSDDDIDVFRRYIESRISNRLNLNELRYVVFSGGGAKGLSYPGVLKALEKFKSPESGKSLFSQIEETSGASAGALISLPVAMGYQPDEIETIVKNQNFGRFFDESVATKNTIRGRMWKKVISQQDIAELEYMEAYSQVIIDRLVQNLIDEAFAYEPKSESEYARKEASFKAQLETMTYGGLKKLAQTVSQNGYVDDWLMEAEYAAEKIYLDKKKENPDLEPFKPFDKAEAAIEFSVRKLANNDKIMAFLQDLIEDKLNSIPKAELDNALPSLAADADRMLERNVVSLLGALQRNSFDTIAREQYIRKGSDEWKECLISSIRQSKDGALIDTEAPGWESLKIEANLDENEMKTAVNAINHMHGQDIHGVGAAVASNKRSDFDKTNMITRLISSLAYEEQRTLYRRNLNFAELDILAEKLPHHGFKKLHVTMCRYGDWKPGKLLSGDLEGFMNERFQRATASAEDLKYQRMPISQAVRISMNLPIGFDSIDYHGEELADGGLVDNLPTHPFVNEEKGGKNKTLICLLGDDGFYTQGRTLKEAVRKNYVGGVDMYDHVVKGLRPHKFLVKPTLLAVKSFITEALYFLSPSHQRISHDDVLRTLLLRSGEVGTTDFGLNDEVKNELINNSMDNTVSALMHGDDVQLAFLQDRMTILEHDMDDESYERAIASTLKNIKPRLREGVFSKGKMKHLEAEMGKGRAEFPELAKQMRIMRGKQGHEESGMSIK